LARRFGPGLLASFLATLTSDYFFLTPGKTFIQNPFEENSRLGLFFLEGILISWGVATLKRMQKALKDADRRKNDFLGMLAHELRNPLAAICSSVELLRLSRKDEQDLEETVEVIESQTRQMIRMADDLLDVSRITHGKVKLQREPVDVTSLVVGAETTCRRLIETRQLRLMISLPPHPVWIDADPLRLTQVLTNLLNNAAKYTDEGGIIWLGVALEGDQVIFRVRDTGIGISPAMLPHIFNLYTQVDASKDRSKGGLGIGLTLVRSLVELHGGRVEAVSAGSGQGSEFVVRMPISSEATIASEQRGHSRFVGVT
jgi:signal transduction histidine kinase